MNILTMGMGMEATTTDINMDMMIMVMGMDMRIMDILMGVVMIMQAKHHGPLRNQVPEKIRA